MPCTSQGTILRAAVLLAIGLLCLSATGCRTAEGPGSDSLAAVQVTAQDPLAIARSLSKVFVEAGFQATPVPANRGREMRMMFEKEGTTKDTVLYGDWSFKSVWYRAKINISAHRLESNRYNYLVTCDVFRVFSRGDKHFEEEHRLKSSKRSYFQELLDKAKADVGTVPAPPAGT